MSFVGGCYPTGRVLLHIGYIGMCCKGLPWFQAVYSGIGCINQRVNASRIGYDFAGNRSIG